MSEPRFFSAATDDGVALLGREWAADADGGRRLPLVCLPGLSRSGRDFLAIAEAIATDASRPRRVIAIDFRGRGGSGTAPPATYTPAREAADVTAVLAALGIGRAAFLGTSRGGLVTMVLALTRPELIGAAILNDIGPVIETAGLARIGGYLGAPPPATWELATRALRASQRGFFPMLDDSGWERYARQIYREGGDRPLLDYDPMLAVSFAAFDPAKPVPEFWSGFEALAGKPVLAIHGALSDILSAATIAAMAEHHPGLAVHTVDGEGHAPLLWDEAAIGAVARFLAAADG